MNQEKIGKFIGEKRKEQKFTQEQLAEKLGVSKNAVSKWERGICLMDMSLLKPLSEILNVSINEILSGEILNDKDYNKKAEENLLQMAQKEEKQNKRLMMYEWVIGTITFVTFIVLMFVLAYVVQNNFTKIILFIISFIILIFGVSFALKIETETGYYECCKCHNKYVPKYKQVYFAMHYGTTRYLKCPKCNKRSWNKKVMSK